MDPTDALIEEAWHQCYLDPERAGALGHQIVAAGRAGIGWLHVALMEVRAGDPDRAMEAQARAREALECDRDLTGLALCDEVLAIRHRRLKDAKASQQIQADVDARAGLTFTPLQSFIRHNSRAITARSLGDADTALTHFYAALDAARRSGETGAEVTALVNLGDFHQGQFNLLDARTLSQQALDGALEIGASRAVATAMANLIMICHAEGRHAQALEQAQQLVASASDLPAGSVGDFSTLIALAHYGVGDTHTAREVLERGRENALLRSDGAVQFAWLMARCHLADGEPNEARRLAVDALNADLSGAPYDDMALYRVAADACAELDDLRSALTYTQRAQALFEEMVARSARASHLALKVTHELELARNQRNAAELSLQRLAELNRALQAKMAETELLHAQLREQALRDTLTGLHNRRYLYEVGPGLVELARRSGAPLCIVLLDLDHFKALNDNHGHEVGDLVLQRFAQVLTRELRRSDVICRYGGEEFVVLMPDIKPEDALRTLARLLATFRTEPQPPGLRHLPDCAFSAGLATFPTHGDALPQLLARADQALYRAKDAGRARSERASTNYTELT